MKLGKKEPRIDDRTLRLARYLPSDLAPPPAAVDWSTKVAGFGMMLNDQLGDCTCSAAGHMIQCWTAANGLEEVVPDHLIQKAYEDVGGYVPGNPDTDNGAYELDVLNYWRKIGIGGHKIAAFVALEPKSRDHVKQAINLFGGAYLGLALPLSAQNQDGWEVALGGTRGDPSPASWGGHAVSCHGYDEEGVWIVTWGQRWRMSWSFWNAYCDESYALLAVDWADENGAPSGLDLEALMADLGKVTS